MHAKTLLLCMVYSILIFFIVINVLPKNEISILACVLSMYFLTTISYYTKDYLDKTKLLNKKLESLSFEEMQQRFNYLPTYTLKCVYDYINRGDKKTENIAMKYGYSVRTIQRIVKKMRETL